MKTLSFRNETHIIDDETQTTETVTLAEMNDHHALQIGNVFNLLYAQLEDLITEEYQFSGKTTKMPEDKNNYNLSKSISSSRCIANAQYKFGKYAQLVAKTAYKLGNLLEEFALECSKNSTKASNRTQDLINKAYPEEGE